MGQEVGIGSWDCVAGHCVVLPRIAAAPNMGYTVAHDVSHFLKYILTCHFGLALSSLTPTTTACLTSTFPWPRHYRWCSIFYCCNSSLESVSPVNAHVNTDRSAKLILQPPKTKYFLMKIQVFHVFIQLELTWNNSLNRKWKICIWLISWHIKAK